MRLSVFASVAGSVALLVLAACGSSDQLPPPDTTAGTGGSAGGSTGGTGGGSATGGASGDTGGATSTGGASGDTGGATSTGGASGTGGGATGGTGGGATGGTGGGATGGTGGGATGGTGGTAGDGGIPSSTCTTPATTCATGVLGHCSCATYPTYPGYTLKLVEDFDAPLDLVTDPNWTYSDGHTDANYTRFNKAGITFTGGNAVLTTTKPAGGVPASTSYAEGEDKAGSWPINVPGATVQSGELRTKYNNWRYGRYEARIKIPKNINVIGAFFTFRNPKWQDWREVDVEVSPAYPDKNCGGNIIKAQGAYAYPGGTTFSTALTSLTGAATIYDAYHTYVMQVEETKTTWYVDDQVVASNTAKLMEKSMKIIFNLWVFNSAAWGGGNPALNTYPMAMNIDWVRLYKKDTDTVYPCSPLPGCQIADDKDYQKNNAEDGLPAAAPW